jgi:hypothetical protein
MIVKACESGEIMIDLIPRLNRVPRNLRHKDQPTGNLQEVVKPCIRLIACRQSLADPLMPPHNEGSRMLRLQRDTQRRHVRSLD